jgi:hypothetical protein
LWHSVSYEGKGCFALDDPDDFSVEKVVKEVRQIMNKKINEEKETILLSPVRHPWTFMFYCAIIVFLLFVVSLAIARFFQ